MSGNCGGKCLGKKRSSDKAGITKIDWLISRVVWVLPANHCKPVTWASPTNQTQNFRRPLLPTIIVGKAHATIYAIKTKGRLKTGGAIFAETSAVIPAQAGIQKFEVAAALKYSWNTKVWIPACAGMTALNNRQFANRSFKLSDSILIFRIRKD